MNGLRQMMMGSLKVASVNSSLITAYSFLNFAANFYGGPFVNTANVITIAAGSTSDAVTFINSFFVAVDRCAAIQYTTNTKNVSIQVIDKDDFFSGEHLTISVNGAGVVSVSVRDASTENLPNQPTVGQFIRIKRITDQNSSTGISIFRVSIVDANEVEIYGKDYNITYVGTITESRFRFHPPAKSLIHNQNKHNMKKLLLSLALLTTSVSLMAQTIKIPAVKETIVSSKVTFADGIVITVVGANNTTTRKPLYLAALASTQTNPPVITPPVTEIRKLLTIDELGQLKDVHGGKYKLKPGIYNQQIWLENVGIDLDLTDVTFEGMNIPAFELNGDCSNLKISGVTFKNMAKCINYKHNGSFAVLNFTLDKIKCENIGGLFGSDGGVNKSGFRGAFNNFTFTNSAIKNSPNMVECIWMGLAENFNIHDIAFDNLNGNVITHAGIFTIVGNGKLYNIKATNYQGNIARFRPLGINKNQTLEAYNVVGYNNSMYSLFEVQVFEEILASGNFNPVAISIHNNTGINLSTLKNREGQILDIYNIGSSTMDYYSNQGAGMFTGSSAGITDMINNNYQINFTRKEGNIYFKSWTEAVGDLITFKPKTLGLGATQ